MSDSFPQIPAGWLRSVIDTVPSHVFIKNAEGRFLLANDAFARFFGLTPDQLAGRTEHDFDFTLSDEQWQALLEQDRELMRTGRTAEIEIQLRAADGLRWFKASKVPLPGEDGSFDKLLCIATDITEHRRATEVAGESQYLVRRILDTTPNLIYIFDLVEHRNVYANREVVEFLGYSAEEIRDMGAGLFARILHPDDMAGIAEHHLRCAAARDDEVLVAEYRMRHASGEWRWLRSRDTPFARAADGSVQQILGTTDDLTEQKQRETDRQMLEAQLLQAQKMEAIGQLAGGVAHDFNNLLTAIAGYAELAEPAAPPDVRADLREIQAATQRAAALTRQLLAFSRKQVLVPTVLNLNEVIADTAKLLARVIGEQVEFAWSGAAHLGLVEADRGQIEQVLMNLAVNARDAMPDGGRLAVSTANVDLERPDTEHGEMPPGRYVKLVVKDTGSGMSAEVQARIFEPFFTTKERDRGTGLGLSTVYGIVKQSGGFIRVDSAPGLGSSFTIYLPRLDSGALADGPEHAASPGQVAAGTVLVVDDEEGVRALAARLLARMDCTVLTASGYDDALAVAERHPGRVDLLLTDIILHGPSGFEIAKRLRDKYPGLAVVLMSGYSAAMDLPDALSRSRTTYLAKPFSGEALRRAIRQVTDRVEDDFDAPRLPLE